MLLPNSIEKVMLDPGTTLRQAMEVIDRAPHVGAPSGIALVVDGSRKLLGVVTDGDLRRAILEGLELNVSVDKIMTKRPVTIGQELSARMKLDEVSRRVREISADRKSPVKIDQVVVVDDSHRAVDIVNFFDLWRQSEPKSRQLAVMGLGYVGLTLAVSLADVGFDVIGVDAEEKVVEMLQARTPNIHEVGLESLLNFHLDKNLRITRGAEDFTADVYIICVQTPVNRQRKPIFTHIDRAARGVARLLKEDDLVIIRSTVPVGTTRNRLLPIIERESEMVGGRDFYLAMAPERTVAGSALRELRELPQIIGGLDRNSSELATSLFKTLTSTIVNVDTLESAELVKLIDNTYRDVNFGYSNEIALVCDGLGLDSIKIIRAANEGYPRNRIPLPSPGVGGVCLRKDPYIFLHSTLDKKFEPRIIAAARSVNELMVDEILDKIEEFGRTYHRTRRMKVFILGFAFKGVPETSDTRDSVTLDLVAKLLKRKSNLFGFDPVVKPEEIEKASVRSASVEDGFRGADCVAIMNNHPLFSSLDIYPLLESMNKPAFFFDGWGIYEKEAIEKVPNIIYGRIGSP